MLKRSVRSASAAMLAWFIASCSADELSDEVNAIVQFQLGGGLSESNSIEICGARNTSPAEALRCTDMLPTQAGRLPSCTCYDLDADGNLETEDFVRGLCPSSIPPREGADLIDDTVADTDWIFEYAVYTQPNCSGGPVPDLECYDSRDLLARANLDRTVEPLVAGLNENHIICLAPGLCMITVLEPDELRFDCGCTMVAGGGCDCSAAGFTMGDLPPGCTFEPACDIVCTSARFPRIEVTNTGVTTLTNYPVHVVLDTRSFIQTGMLAPDCSNLRIFGGNACAEPRAFFLPAHSCNTERTEIWLLVPTLAPGAREVFSVQFSTAGQGSNGNQVFPALFDDFPGTALNTANWTTRGGGALTLSGGILRTFGARLLESATARLSPNTQVAGMRVSAESKFETDVEFGIGTVTSVPSATNLWAFERNWRGLTMLSYSESTIGFRTTDATGVCRPTGALGPIGPAWADFGMPATFQTVEFRYSVTNVITGMLQTSRGLSLTASNPSGCTVTTPQPVLIVPDHWEDVGSPTQQIDYVYIRPFSMPEPTATFLSESILACGTQP